MRIVIRNPFVNAVILPSQQEKAGGVGGVESLPGLRVSRAGKQGKASAKLENAE